VQIDLIFYLYSTKLFLWSFENLDKRAETTFPDIDIMIHKRRGHNIVCVAAERNMVPAQSVDHILEFMFDFQVDAVRLQVRVREVRQLDRSNDSV
jgi:hypothetical protein